jgi:hypothetical protein
MIILNKVRGILMNYFKKILFIHSIILISLLVCSCGTTHSIRDDVIYKDDNFNYSQLMNGGVVIGGIASQRINFTKKERNQYSSHLSTILIEELKDVRITNTSQLTGKIGKRNYYSIIKEYDTEQMLSTEDMRVIKESFPEIEYILFVYIESEHINNDSYTESTADSEGKYKTVYKTTYSLAAEFQIYDLSREQLVWNNIMYNEAVKTQNREEDSFLGVVTGDVMSSAFVEIDREDVLEEIYEEFAEGLAENKN